MQTAIDKDQVQVVICIKTFRVHHLAALGRTILREKILPTKGHNSAKERPTGAFIFHFFICYPAAIPLSHPYYSIFIIHHPFEDYVGKIRLKVRVSENYAM